MSDRTRQIALYCIEPSHDQHDSILAYPDPIRTDTCAACITAVTTKAIGTRRLLKVELMHMKRGYVLYVTQVDRERRDYGESEGHTLFAPYNLNQLMQPATRFNAKTLATLPVDPALIAELVHRSRLLRDEEDAKRAARQTA